MRKIKPFSSEAEVQAILLNITHNLQNGFKDHI